MGQAPRVQLVLHVVEQLAQQPGECLAPLRAQAFQQLRPGAGAGRRVTRWSRSARATRWEMAPAVTRECPARSPQAPGPDTGTADFAEAFDLTAWVLAALAVGTALLAVRLGRVPTNAEAAADTRAEVGQGPFDATVHPEEPAVTDTGR
ncbi:hypothetical protein [Streptomyces sp. DH10]|uniref:hypothetical protein n=1 Tax=Streptomyces sp. DH10 TaxID=3040121 RepID=UPI00301541E0